MSFNCVMSSLNVRGIGELKKRKKIFNWLKKHGSENGIAFLQETYSSKEIEGQWTKNFKGEIIFDHGTSHSKGVAILLGNELDYKIISKEISNEGRFIILKLEIQSQECTLINSYLPNIEKDQISVLQSLVTKLESMDARDSMNIIWGGDFNLYFDLSLETFGGNPKLKVRSLEQLLVMLEELDLCDIWRIRNSDSKRFTWSGSAQGQASTKFQKLYRRLDYFFISDSLQTATKEVKIVVAPSTDHSALLIRFYPLAADKYGPSFWKFNTSLLKDKKFTEKMQNVIAQTKRDFNNANPNVLWEMLKYEIRKLSIAYSKMKARNRKNTMKELEEEIEEIENKENWYLKDSLVNQHAAVKAKLNDYHTHITEGLLLRSKALWIEQGEKSNKFFLNLEKSRKSKTHVRKIIDEKGKEITEPKAILENLRSFYANIYENKNNYSEQECLNLISEIGNIEQLNNLEREKLEGQLSVKECYDSLWMMKNGKTPGNDGIPKEFYLQFWNELGREMVSSFNYSYNSGLLSTSQRQVTVTLLEKKGKDVRFVENWRPISLLNVDVKVCSKALANRMLNILPKLIHPNQAAFVPGRNIQEPLRYISDIFEFSKEHELSYILFAADFKKAFDSVEHNFIFATLKYFGFGESFISWVRLLLTDIRSCIQNNGYVSDFFTLKRGTKQGDPISPYLFILVIEVLAELVRKDNLVQGVQLSDKSQEVKVVLFADDASFTLKNEESLERCLDILKRYGNFSSLQINHEKSEVGWLGVRKDTSTLPRSIKKIDLQNEGITILGISFSHNQSYILINNIDRVFEKFKAILNLWRQRKLTLYGKSLVVKVLALSQLQFVFSNMYFPKQYVKKVKDEIVNFLWNGKKAKIKYGTLINDYDKGGIKLPDIETMIKANRVRWAIKVLNSDKSSYWRIFGDKWTERTGGLRFIENLDPTRFFAINNKLPMFYVEIFQAWCQVCNTEVHSEEDILRQPLFLNEKIALNINSISIKSLLDRNIFTLSHVWRANKPNWDKVREIGWEDNEYMLWRSILDAIPNDWRKKLKKHNYNIDPKETVNSIVICVGNESCSLSKASSKKIYTILLHKQTFIPTAQKNIEKKCKSHNVDWSTVYNLIYSSTIDTTLRAFEYKIKNNCLYLNQKLFTFGKVSSSNCSFCNVAPETMVHFFVDCPFTKQFYYECRDWLQLGGIMFPNLTLESVLLGYIEDCFVNFLFVLWKWKVYSSRSSQKRPGLIGFQEIIKMYRKIEYDIAERKNKIFTHLEKYDKINKILR